MNGQTLIQKATARQNNAADVKHSVWLSASAGTGKTRVLTTRIVRLLLSDFTLKPSEILAVTFTRAAAREMENRIRDILSSWATLPEEVLKEELQKTLTRPATATEISRARSLFHIVLQDPVHTNTIHGFCQHLLGRFPVEADLTPGFKVLDETESSELLSKARTHVLVKAFSGHLQPEWAFQYFAENLGEGTLASRLNMFVWHAHRFEKLIARHGSVENTLSALADALNVKQGLLPQHVSERPSVDGVLDLFAKILPHLNELKGATAGKFSVAIADVLADPKNEARIYQTAMKFFKTDGEPMTARYALGKKTWEENGIVVQLFHEIQNTMAQHLEKARAQHTYLLSASLLCLGNHVFRTYGELKQAQGVLDFDDLIRSTSSLLKNSNYGDWIRFKLDSNIRHALLDEAQDTDSTQWHIIRSFVEEFYAGAGQHTTPRTFFAVGDVKQSIYRFRGAEPFVFGDMRDYMLTKQEETGNAVAVENLVASFRSSATILNFVDDVFRAPHRREAVDSYIEELVHDAIHAGAGGRIELWPLLQPERSKKEPREPWTLPVLKQQKPTIKQQVAANVADSIVDILNSNDILHTTGKRATAGDIMILLRARTMMPELIEALDARKLPHTGADTLTLNTEPLVEDMLQLMTLATNPSDTFARTQVLKSPLFGWDDAALLTKTPLPIPLVQFIEEAPVSSAYAFLMQAQSTFHIRAKYYVYGDRRQVDEVFDALLDTALNQHSTLNLTQFVHMFKTVPQKIKRELAGATGRIRLLTAHGAKGLEAPIVYMPDAGKDFYAGLARETQLWDITEDNQDNLFIARLAKADACAFQKETEEKEKQRMFRDEMRLLYVALTRAKDRLYITGEGKGDAESWYTNILHALQDNSHFVQLEDGRYILDNPVHTEAQEATRNAAKVQDSSLEEGLPCYLTQSPKKEGVAQVLKASKTLEQTALELPDVVKLKKLFSRGQAVHKLLEILPTLEAHAQKEKAHTYVQQTLADFSEIEQQQALSSAFVVMKKYAEFFGENSRAEVPVFAEKQGKRFEGIIDRLVVRESEVIILDYKTDSHVPEGVPDHYAEQLRIYAWALSDVFPDKLIRAGIIWTSLSTPRLDWVIDSGGDNL